MHEARKVDLIGENIEKLGKSTKDMTPEQKAAKNAAERARRQRPDVRAKVLEAKKAEYQKRKDSAVEKAKMAKNAKANYNKNLAYVQDRKLETGCNECGYKENSRALSYVHIDSDSGKSFQVSSCYTRSLENLKEEIEKCVLLCGNCQLELNYQEGWQEKWLADNRAPAVARRSKCEKLKKENGCKYCGNKNHKSLCFHHRDPEEKLMNVSLLYKRKDEFLEAELKKCDIVCANCHMKHHQEENNL